jgi:hypothetical protein
VEETREFLVTTTEDKGIDSAGIELKLRALLGL